MNVHWWPIAALGLTLAACGGEEKQAASTPAAAAATADTAAATATATAAADTLPPEEQAAADVAVAYAQAIAKEDWEAACATRTESEQKEAAKLGGSCPKTFAKLFEGKPTDLFADVEAGEVRIEGEKAGIDLVQPGQDEPALTLGAVMADGEWRLEDMKDSEIP